MHDRSIRSFHGEALEPRLLLSCGYTLAADTSFIPEPEGTQPSSLIVDRNGNLFGTTQRGGVWNDGTVFEIPSGTPTVQTLLSFDGTVGSGPSNLAIDPNGDLFGTTGGFDGMANDGSVFEISAGSGTVTLLAALGQVGITDPSGALIYFNGNLYGAGSDASEVGGQTKHGVVFALNPDTGTFTTLATFTGVTPIGGLALGPDGNLIGAMFANGTGDPTTVFEVPTSGGALTTLATFGFDETPIGGVTADSAGDIFGMTASTSTNWGDRVFEIPQATHSLQTIASFAGTSLAGLYTPMTVDANGNLYGTAGSGGANDAGGVFEVPHDANTIMIVASGAESFAPLVLGPDGALFGITPYGGTDSQGTVFRLADNAVVTLATFTDTNPSQPSGPLISDPAGDLFGTTSAGGENKEGTVFEIPRGGSAITVMANFDANIQKPAGNLVMDSSGNLFGTAAGTDGYGTSIVFELPHNSTTITELATVPRREASLAIDANGDLFGLIREVTTSPRPGKIVPVLPAGVFEIPHGTSTVSTVAQFGLGVSPNAITVDHAGNIFGALSSLGGPESFTIFDIASGSHTINALAQFSNLAGAVDSLTVDSSDDLFGILTGVGDLNGGTNGGTFFELAHGARQLNVLATLPGSARSATIGPLVIDADGDVFGEERFTDTSGDGAVLEVPKNTGTWTTLLDLSGPNGAGPLGITLDPDGNIVGTASAGGTSGDGTFFKLSPGEAPTPTPSRLELSGLPPTIIAGEPLRSPVTVSVLDATGQVITTDDSTVTLSVLDSSAPAATATAINGVATFPNFVIGQTGAVNLAATDGTLTAGAELIVYQPLPLVAHFGKVRVPAGMSAGSVVNLNVPLTLTNTGRSTFANYLETDLFTEPGTTLDGNQTPIASDYPLISLRPGATVTLSVPIRSLPATLAPGTYHLVASLIEADFAASVKISAQTVTVTPAFIEPAVSVGVVSPATLAAGQIASVSVTVTNQGNVAARGVDLTLSPSSDGVTPISGVILDRFQSNIRIAPNHSKTFRLRFQVPRNLPPGAYLPFVSCLLAGVTAAGAGSVSFNIVGSAAPAK